MAVYQGLYGSSFRFVRADSMGEAVKILRQAFGFSPKGYVSKAGDNAHSVGFPLAYDEAANRLEGANHPALKRERIKSRSRYAAGKGAPMPAGVEILTF